MLKPSQTVSCPSHFQGKRVLRLKGGCPSTFSRVSSEAAALAAAGCPFELVPGLSTATAAPVLAGEAAGSWRRSLDEVACLFNGL